jgi:DNA-binding transcriptional regulator LsrR (DeoR family)
MSGWRTAWQAAEALGVSVTTVNRMLRDGRLRREAGLIAPVDPSLMRPSQPRRKPTVERVAALISRRPMTQAELMAETGLSQSRISRALRDVERAFRRPSTDGSPRRYSL